MQSRLWRLVPALALAAAMPALAASDAPTPQDHAAERAQLFATADANGDGVLSPQEFATFMKLVRSQRAAHRFARLDQNGDGAISAEELAAGKPGCGHRGPQL